MIGLEAAASAVCYIALALVLGPLFVGGFLLPQRAPQELRRGLVAGAHTALLVFLGVALCGLMIQGAKLQRGLPSLELLGRYLGQTQSGQVWLAREIYGAALAVGMWLLIKGEPTRRSLCVFALLVLPLAASRSLMSHAAALRENALLAMGSDALHLIAAGLWAGGLFALWRITSFAVKQATPTLTWSALAIVRFSRLAFASVALLVVTGAFQSWIHVGTLTALANSTYGKALLVKLLLFAIMLAFGALNFFLTSRKTARAIIDDRSHQPPLAAARRRIACESVIGLSVFCAAGMLTVLPPGVHMGHSTGASAAHETEKYGAKTFPAAQGARLQIITPQPNQVFTGDQVAIWFELVKGERGHHAHAYVDGELVGMFESEKGTLTGIKPGRHVLELRVVANDHTTELDASDRVEFTVE